MLKGIPQIFPPALLKVLCEMGHSDRIVITDGNFPAESMGKNNMVIRMDICTTAILEYGNGSKTHIDCGMVLETERNSSLDRFQIHGSKGSIASVDFAFNAPGTLSYRLRTFDGRDELRTVEVPNNYCLEVEQMGRCIAGEEKPHVTEEFSVALAETVDRILKKIGY